MESAFSGSFMASGGGWKHPPEISKTRNGMTMKFLPLVGTYMEAQNNIFFIYLAWSLITDKNPEYPGFWKGNF